MSRSSFLIRHPSFLEQSAIRRQRGHASSFASFVLTPQRLEIINVLPRDTPHPGARNILQKVRTTAPRISVSTVYYALDVMKKEGLLRELEFYDKDNRYNINVSNHINLVCTRCGKITDVVSELSSFSRAVEEETGFEAARVRFEYYGICRDAQV